MYGCNKKKKGGIYPKFTKSWKCPYFIAAKISDLLYKIKKNRVTWKAYTFFLKDIMERFR